MATYTGDPTATQPPASQPAPGDTPTVNIVTDLLTPVNAASVNQQFKAFADDIAWLKTPRAKAAAGSGTSTWDQAIAAFKSAQLFTRFGIDHHGFPAGQIIQWDENWDDLTAQVADLTVSSSGNFGTHWLYQVTNPVGPGGTTLFSGGSTHVGGGPSPYPSSRIIMTVPTVGGPVLSVAAVQRAMAPVALEPSGATVISMHWDQMTTDAGLNNSSAGQVAMGLAASSIFGSTAVFASAGGLNPIGAAFMGGQGVATRTTWSAYVNNNGTIQLFDTGVDCNTPGVRRRFRIDVIGAAVSDDGISRVLFWIDGALVSSQAIDLAGAGGIDPRPFFRLWGEGGAVGSNFGPVRFRANLWSGDVFI